MKLLSLIFTLYFLINLSACTSTPITEGWSAERLFTEATEALEYGDFEMAIKYYEILESRYPSGKYVQQAQLNVIYAYYKDQNPESAIIAADRFIRFSPRHPNVDYVYYLKGLVFFENTRGALDRFLALDRAQRDQGATMRSIQAFSELIARFPKSKYSIDAKQRIIYQRNMQARHELHVAIFYLKRGAYVAAANRANTVIKSYQGTPSVAKALVILAKSYKIMELNDLSDDALRVLKLNYPTHVGIAEVINLVVK